jgi:dipeptidyl-peptidase 4
LQQIDNKINRKMKKIMMMCLAALLAVTGMRASDKMDLKRLAQGEFSASRISGIDPLAGTDQYAQISQDGKQIVQYSFKTGKKTGVLFDVDNTQGEKISSFDGYMMAPDGKRMLVRTNTQMIYRRSFKAEFYIYTVGTRKLEHLSTGGPQEMPVWSPDGTQVAFMRDNNIFLVKLLYDNSESQVTKDGKFNEIINGVPDWVNEEEFSFNSALTFNADGTMLCWLKYDESKVKEYSLQLFKGLNPERKEYEVYPGSYSYKYPKAGEDNSKVSAWSYDIKSHKTRQLQVPLDADGYMPRILPTDNADKILVYTMNRHQDVLNLYTVNPRSTLSQLLIKESVSKYVKEEAMEAILVGKDYVLMPSDRDGYMHLYLYDQNGKLLRKIGDGNYDITSVYGYDEKTGDVYYQAAMLNPHDRQICVTHKNGKTVRLTNQEGWNDAIFSGDYKYFVNTWSDINNPYVYTTRNNQGKVIATHLDNKELKDKTLQYGWTNKEMFSFTSSEGVKLDGWMIKPADFDPNKKYPVIMFQYSGPGNQQVVNSWNAGSMGQGCAYDQYLAQQGFIVVCVDGRGTGGRGAEFEKCTYQHLGNLEAKDQVETALYLGSLPYVDKDNIGIWGWSYGGYCTLMSMSEGRAVFKAGVAVAPPTSYRFYDTVYTERYMRTPQENPDGYADCAISRADKLHGSLLICHGAADDNVHPQNTFEYTEALVQADKDFKEMLYTNRNHGIYGGNTRNHLLRQITNWFVEHLKK